MNLAHPFCAPSLGKDKAPGETESQDQNGHARGKKTSSFHPSFPLSAGIISMTEKFRCRTLASLLLKDGSSMTIIKGACQAFPSPPVNAFVTGAKMPPPGHAAFPARDFFEGCLIFQG
jgi:hypothetical protein